MEYLDFEQPIIELEKRIEELELTAANLESSVDHDKKVNNLSRKHETLTKEIFTALSESFPPRGIT